MAYDPRIIEAIKQRAGQITDPRKRDRYTRAALQTGIVESGLQNLSGGDSDSVNWRQERASIYGGDMSVSRSVDRFFNEAAQLDRGQPSWQLAADVQRPAAQYRGRYKQVAKQAASLLGSPSATAGSTPVAAAGPSGSGQPAAPSQLTDPGTTGDFTGLLGQLLARPERVQPMMAVAPPSFSARAPLPQGFQAPTPEVQAAPDQAGGVEGALSLLGALRGTDPASAASGAAGAAGGQPETVVTTVMNKRAAAKAAGVSPNARPGDPVVSSKQSVGGLHQTAGLAGFPAHDYMAPAGSHAVAPVSGTVIKLSGHNPASGPTNGPHGPFGYSLYIKGTDGKTYFLTHMGSRTVKAGQTVKQGQVIGTVGDYAKWGGADHIHQGVSG